MKKLTLALLLISGSTAFAQQNELVIAPAFVRYHAHHSQYKPGGIFDLNGIGYQLGVMYLYNINWLQIGGSFEVGKLNSSNDRSINLGRHNVGNPYAVFNALVNGRLLLKKWTFYGGACGGYMVASAHNLYKFGGWQGGDNYTTYGFYKGGQIGAAYHLHDNVSLSADFTARFAKRQHNAIDTTGGSNDDTTPYNRVHLYNFSIGVHYKF
jgi:hypothetical protein